MIHPTVVQLETFLRQVDDMFPVPLSQRRELHAYAEKLYDKATVCAEMEGDRIIALAVGYTDQVIDNIGYLSVVATLPEARGKGLASKLIRQFLAIAKEKQLSGVHLYTNRTNEGAIALYRKLGFVDYQIPNETRKNSVHLIFMCT